MTNHILIIGLILFMASTTSLAYLKIVNADQVSSFYFLFIIPAFVVGAIMMMVGISIGDEV